MSPTLHNKAFDLLKLDYVYLAFRVSPQNLVKAIDGMRVMENFRGLSVTIPHKVAVIDCVDDLSPADASIGSINTIVNENGRLRGLGSDGPGARQALLDNDIEPSSKTVTILGTGGAARAIAFDMIFHTSPKRLKLCGIVEDEVRMLASDVADKTDIPVDAVIISEDTLADAVSKSQVLINATPVGMYPKTASSPVPKNVLHPELAVMDIVYNPLETQLLKDAKNLGLKTVSGLEMFVNQAVIQFESWTQARAPKAAMREVVLKKLQS